MNGDQLAAARDIALCAINDTEFSDMYVNRSKGIVDLVAYLNNKLD